MKSRLLLLLLGIVLGLAAAQLAPRFWHRLTPEVLRGAPTVGSVESKRWDDEHLLLTLVTDGGAVLATFTKRVAEIDLLVDVGDTVELGLRRYRPFVEDPVIDRVVKAQRAAAGPAGADPAPVAPAEPAAEPPTAAGPGEELPAAPGEPPPAGDGASPDDAPAGDAGLPADETGPPGG